VFENVFEEIAKCDEARDIVFLCDGEKLTYHSEIVAAVFPYIKKFVQNSKGCPCSLYIQKRAEIFISLDGVNPATMKQIMGCIYENKPLKFSQQTLGEVRNIFKMLGVDDKLFVVEKTESRNRRPDARNGDVFRKVLGNNGTLDVNKRKMSVEGEDEQIAKKRLIDISINDEPETVHKSKGKASEEQESSNTSKNTLGSNENKDVVPGGNNQRDVERDEPIKNDNVSQSEGQLKELQKSKSKEETIEIEKTESSVSKIVKEPVSEFTKEVGDASEQKPKDTNLQKILPHLTVTTIKQEPNNDSDSLVQMPLIKQEPVESGETQPKPLGTESTSTLRCPIAICSSEIVFKTRSEILLHLTQAHYTDGLLDLYPFNKGQPCTICVEEKKPKVLIAQMKNRFVAHVGVNHEVVLDLLPAELKEILMVLPKRMKKLSTQEVSSLPKPVDVTLDEAPPTTTQTEQYPVYPEGYNYNYPGAGSYSQQSYPNETGYQQQSYPPYNNYPQYPSNAPSYPSYNSYPFEPSASNQQHAGAVIKDEPPAAVVKEEPKVVIKEEPLDPDTMYRCTLCTARSFGQRSDLLFHLSITHFSRNLMKMYPFKEHQICPLCNVFTPKNMSSHISHVGLKHEEVIKFVPADLAATLTNTASDTMQPKPVVRTDESSNVAVAANVAVAPIIQAAPMVAPPVDKPVSTQVESKPQPVTSSNEDEPTVQCEMCKANNKERLFTKRSEFLKHLSLLHFGKALLAAFPFAEGRNCNLCFETSKKMYTPSKKEVHVCHVGVLHAKIFELLPKEILQTVMEMPTMKKPVPNSLEKPMQGERNIQATGSQPAMTATVEVSKSSFQHPPQPSTSAPVASLDATSTNQEFAPPPTRDVVFNLPINNLPTKEEFKMPMTRTDKPYNCRYCVSGFDNAKDLKDHLLTHKSQFSQINQTPRKMNSSLVNLRMNTPRK